MARFRRTGLPLVVAALLAAPATADTFYFTTDAPDGRMAAASRPAGPGKIEIEAADDFLLTAPTTIRQASFSGLFTGGAIGDVTVEIYRVFPLDSTSPPSGSVPTRTNSPSDVAFASRSSAAGTLTFSATALGPSLAAANSVLNGIHPVPNQTTGGDGPVSGQQSGFNITFNPPIVLPAGHYFFVPQVEITGGGDFYWYSSAHPISSGTPFAGDLQSWIRNESLSPNWLRIGTDIVGGNPAPTFNGVFSLAGDAAFVPAVPALSTLGLFALALLLAALALVRLRSLKGAEGRADR